MYFFLDSLDSPYFSSFNEERLHYKLELPVEHYSSQSYNHLAARSAVHFSSSSFFTPFDLIAYGGELYNSLTPLFFFF